MLNKRYNLKGFTMIELLVVIAVIGVLAVAVLSSINPLEQINKGRDTKRRSDAAQILNAIDRYYASQEKYPFSLPISDLSDINVSHKDILTALVNTKEIKSGFKTRLLNDDAAENYLYIYVDPNTATTNSDVESIYVCFKPSSESFKRQSAEHASDWSFVTDKINSGNYYICLP